jgi:hypothetical protein
MSKDAMPDLIRHQFFQGITAFASRGFGLQTEPEIIIWFNL